MSKKLAGVTFIRNGFLLDYCFEAAIRSLQAVSDHVIVVYVEGDDDTFEVIQTVLDGKTTILQCSQQQWDEQKGKEKISYFQNIGIEYAQREGYEYVYLVQSDEVTHEDSIPYIKQALVLGEEAYFCSRYNMWGSDTTMLNVRQSRKPCSTVVNRLCKSHFRSVDDGENMATTSACLDFINRIEIFHCGFIRDPKKHIAKIKEIQGNIFGGDYDRRADLKPEFDWKDWGFTYDDLISIHKPLPVYVKDWVQKLNK